MQKTPAAGATACGGGSIRAQGVLHGASGAGRLGVQRSGWMGAGQAGPAAAHRLVGALAQRLLRQRALRHR